jgi:hypothetical protein
VASRIVVAALAKAEREVAEFRNDQQLSQQLVEIDTQIRRSRPIEEASPSLQKKTREAIQREVAREVDRLLRRTIPCACGHSAHYKELRSKTRGAGGPASSSIVSPDGDTTNVAFP